MASAFSFQITAGSGTALGLPIVTGTNDLRIDGAVVIDTAPSLLDALFIVRGTFLTTVQASQDASTWKEGKGQLTLGCW